MPVDIQHLAEEGQHRLLLSGALDEAAVAPLMQALKPLFRHRTTLVLDLSRVDRADALGLAALAECLVMAGKHGCLLRGEGAQGTLREQLAEAPAPGLAAADVQPKPPLVERLGASTQTALEAMTALTQLLADTAYWGIVAPLRGRFPPRGATALQAIRIGVDALPIVSLIAFLLGLIMAFQAAHQLRQFGANIFVANLVGIAIVRELGPIMTAIIIAGRSGSSIAAELGTMTVGEEIDALRIMGIEPIRFLVVPRIYAITFTQPALTLFANAVGVFGGFLIAVLYLDLSAHAYINQTIEALTLSDLFTGLAKSFCFAWVTALIGCHCGLRITGGAEGVGRATTASVVASIFAIIVVDSIFTTLSTVL
ncbi:MAG: MlaE family lipid ABC transporter permease subunit [Deltaproteobacteria bacterium]|nr:MlaE family lipid ABC transporter permease subunit [Deltaproteobacteria bacterium]